MSVDGDNYQAWVEAQNDPPGDQTAAYFANDFQESAKLSKFYPDAEKTPWWASLATYGVTKAIDAAVGPKISGSGGQQSTYAGQNGRTYVNGKASTGPDSDSSLLLLVGIVGLLYFAAQD